MNCDNYLLYVLGTVDSYTIKAKKHLRKLFIEQNIVQKDSQITFENIGEDCVDVSEMALAESLKYAIKTNKNAVKIFEKWEFEKDYKYSVLFDCDNFSEIFGALEEKLKSDEEHDESSQISESFDVAVGYKTNDMIMLKYNMLLSVLDPTNQNELLIKYPFLVVLNKKIEAIEFRFDAIKRVFLSEKDEQNIYSILVKNIRNILKEQYQLELTPIDMEFMTNLPKMDVKNAVVMAEYRKLPTGGNAQLEVGKNEDYRLPIIGDLKDIIKKHQLELDKVPSLYNSLKQFIFENDELSDYTWIEVMWPAEVKTRSIRVKFIFNYKGENYTLIQHYSNNALIGMERMNDVIKYISEYRKIDQRKSSNE